MLSIRQTAVAVGVLFLTATITFLFADSLITGVLGNPDALVDATAYGNVLKAGALLAFVNGLAVVGIAVLIAFVHDVVARSKHVASLVTRQFHHDLLRHSDPNEFRTALRRRSWKKSPTS